MLRLTRKKGEAVYIRTNGKVIAVVRVLDFLPNDTVELGFDAERSVDITRDNMRKEKDHGSSQIDGDKNGNRY